MAHRSYRTQADPGRAVQIRIQIARRETGIDDATYRAWLRSSTGLDSTSGMTVDQLHRVLGRIMVETGWRPGAGKPPADGPANYDDPRRNPMCGKLYALIKAHGWSWAYVRAVARRMYDRDNVEHPLETLSLRQLHRLTAELAEHGRRLDGKTEK